MDVLLTWWPTIAYTAVLAALATIAARYSGRTANLVALACLAEQLATLALTWLLGRRSISLVGSDLLTFLVLIWIGTQTAQRWPVIPAAFQALTLLGRLAQLLDPRIWPMAFAILIAWTAWPIAVSVAIGIWLDRRPAASI